MRKIQLKDAKANLALKQRRDGAPDRQYSEDVVEDASVVRRVACCAA
jgi:hypothetical protein